MGSLLFLPLTIRGVTIPNRVVMPPLCQYSAIEGLANDWHMVQLGRFAVGGFGLIFTEVTSVMREGRITHGDLGLWSDAHIEPVQRLARFIKAQGAVPAMQLGHAGRFQGVHARGLLPSGKQGQLTSGFELGLGFGEAETNGICLLAHGERN